MIAAGSFHALALQEDGRVLSWGNGEDVERELRAHTLMIYGLRYRV
jgi:alpha-tubulin suppressor-like RCC1 family protein